MAREKNLEKQLREKVKARRGLCLKWTSHHFIGMPDRIILLQGGRVVFAEVKTTGEKPTEIQEHRIEMLRAMGFPVFVIDSYEKLEEVYRCVSNPTPTNKTP